MADITGRDSDGELPGPGAQVDDCGALAKSSASEHSEVLGGIGAALLVVKAGHEGRIEVFVPCMVELVYLPRFGHIVDSRAVHSR